MIRVGHDIEQSEQVAFRNGEPTGERLCRITQYSEGTLYLDAFEYSAVE
jgi:hypothetical protein